MSPSTAEVQRPSLGARVLEPIAALGGATMAFLEGFGAISRLAFHMFKVGPRRPFELSELVRQLYKMGAQSVSIAFLTALFTGAVMALQFGWSLERFGAACVGRFLAQELEPVPTRSRDNRILEID